MKLPLKCHIKKLYFFFFAYEFYFFVHQAWEVDVSTHHDPSFHAHFALNNFFQYIWLGGNRPVSYFHVPQKEGKELRGTE